MRFLQRHRRGRTRWGHRRFSLSVGERLVHQRGGSELGFDEWVRLLVSPGAALAVDAAFLEERSQKMIWHAVADVLGGVLVELGLRWQRGELNVVEVNVASERLSRALTRATDTLASRARAPTALLATAENESHTLGLCLVELCMREWGWKTVWIGRDMPTELLARGLEDPRQRYWRCRRAWHVIRQSSRWSWKPSRRRASGREWNL